MSSEPAIAKLIHLALFVGGAGFLGIGAVASIERLTPTGRPTVRGRHVMIALTIVLALVAIERVYHLTT